MPKCYSSLKSLQGTFDSWVFQVSLKSFGAFPIFNNLSVSRKRIDGCRVNQMKILALMVCNHCIQGTFDKVFRSS